MSLKKKTLQPRRSVFFTHATIIRESSRGNSLFKLCIKRAKGTFDDFQRKRSTRRARTNQRGFPAICRDGEPVSSAYHRLEVEKVSSRVAHAGVKKGYSMKFFSPTRWTRWGRNPRIIERLKSWGEGWCASSPRACVLRRKGAQGWSARTRGARVISRIVQANGMARGRRLI